MQFSPSIAAAIQAGDTVIASSARAARALRRIHAETQRSQGLQAWRSADILDWDSWLNRLWNKKLRSGSESRLLLTPLQEQQIWVRLVKPSIEGRRLISPASVADLAQEAYALLCAYRAFDFLRGPQAYGADVESFGEWARDFERLCHEEDFLSRSKLPLVLGDALGDAPLETMPKVLLVGFDRTTPAQQHLIDALRGHGCEIEMDQAAEVPSAEVMLLAEGTEKRDEIATCALWVRRELMALGPTARIAVVVPGVATVRAEIERVFREVLAPATVAISANPGPLPYEFSLGVPLSAVPMARSALLLLRWMKHSLSPDQVSWLMLSGFLCEEEDELLPMAELDAKIRSRSMRQPEQDLNAFLQFAPPDKLSSRLRHGRRLLPHNDSLNFAQWVQVAEQILDAVHWPGAHVLRSEDFQVQARWTQLLDNVAALAFDGRTVSYKEFLEVLEHQAEPTIFAAESRDAPVQILGPFEAAGLSFDALWFLGADDANWPGVARPHPFLPRSLQLAHSMPHADSTTDWKLAQEVTARLERSAAKCVFSFSSQNTEGVCRPSTLVTSIAQRISAEELRISVDPDAKTAAEAEFLALPIEEEPAEILPWPAELDAGGAEILRRQAACAFQSFATRRLGARPMDAMDWGLEPRDRGSVVHEILAGLWDTLKTHDALLAARADRSLHALVEQQVVLGLKKYRDRTREHTWSQAYLDAEQERIISLMEDWLEYEAGRATFTVEAGEKKLPAAVGDLKLQVRVDRIDAVDGGQVIIDYKTGMLSRISWDGLRPDEPQLPLYAGFGQIDNLKGVLLARVRDDMMKFIGRAEDAQAVMPRDAKLIKPYDAAMLESWRNALLDLGRQFLRGEAQVNPKQYPKTCEFCDLSPLCRIAENDPVSSGDEADDTDG
jgi:ATP-dependent helicase/nuclease subunit B